MEKAVQKKHNQILGRWGEDVAAQFMIGNGFLLTARNVRTPEGEIDLIVEKEDQIVFLEVKTRKNLNRGYPEEAVSDEKLEHMINSAEWYLNENSLADKEWRLDVISVLGTPGSKSPQIEWFQDAS